MAFIHKAQFSWFMVLAFIILLMLKLDGRINDWNWFIIFIPMWILDAVVAIYIAINMIMHCKNQWWHNGRETSLCRKTLCLFGTLMKLLFQVLLCLRLQYRGNCSLYYVMIPFWILNLGCIVDVFTNLWKMAKRGVD